MAQLTTGSMTLGYLPANAAYAFLFGDSPIRVRDESLFFATRRDAIRAANHAGLHVDSHDVVTTYDCHAEPGPCVNTLNLVYCGHTKPLRACALHAQQGFTAQTFETLSERIRQEG